MIILLLSKCANIHQIMKPFLPQILLALGLVLSYNSTQAATTNFNKNSCNKALTGEAQEICHQALTGDSKARYVMARFFSDPQNGDLVNMEYAFYWHLTLSRQILKEKLKDVAFTSTLYNTGVLYHDGLGTKRDLKKAFFWFNKAAQRGEPLAMVRVAVAYEHGTGVKMDDEKSIKWLNKAITLNNPKAKVAMAQRLLTGKGVDTNPKQSVKYLKEAAQQNSPEANFILGSLYLTGTHLPKDKALAKNHYGNSCGLNVLEGCKRYYEMDIDSTGLQQRLLSNTP